MSNSTDTNSNNNNNDNFPYNASKPAAVLFAVLFGLVLLAHLFQAAKARVLFILPLLFATFFQVVGYATRLVAIEHDTSLAPYVVSQTCIVVAPALLAAQDYMIVGRMMAYIGPESTWISHTIITKLFVFIDIVCVLTQATGISVLSGNQNNRNSVSTGRAILIGGLIFQVGSFGVFMLLGGLFDWKSRQVRGKDVMRPLRPLFIAFYVSATLVIGRSIYRTIEFATINFNSEAQGYLYNNEWPFYVLDAIPVIIATVAFNVVHPAKHLPKKKGLRIDGTMEPARKHWWSKAVDTKPSTNTSDDMLQMNRRVYSA